MNNGNTLLNLTLFSPLYADDLQFQHDVDVVIEVAERGKAVQNGRFNQGGEMRIFE